MNFLKMDDYLERIQSKYNVPGFDCIIYKNHEMIYRKFSGFSDVENHTEINGNELYYIFSMTKMITVVAALQLFEQGKFLLSDPVCFYLPEFSDMKIAGESADECHLSNHTITIKNLFTMSAGFDYNLNSKYISEAISDGKTSTREIVGSFSNAELGFIPGTRFRYSLCHDILGALIEVISGKTLGEYFRENIFLPLDMEDIFFNVPKNKQSRLAKQYTYTKTGDITQMPSECIYKLTEKYESGGAGLVSSAKDYAKFLDAIANGGIGKNGNRILSPYTIELMKTNQLKDKALEDFNNLRKGYGYGLGVRTHLDKSVSGSLSPVGEFGWDGAAGGFSMVDTGNALSLCYFQHVHNWDIRLQQELRNVVYSCLN